MKHKITRFMGIALMVLAVSGFSSCTKKNDGGTVIFKVGYGNSSDSDFFDKSKRDAFEVAVKKDPSIQVSFSNANADMQLQLDQIDNFIAQKMNAIIVVPVDSAGVIPGIEKANKAGIPIICLGIDASGGDYVYVGTQYYDAGERQGKYLAEHLPENANVLYLSGTPGYNHSRDRRAGFLETLAKSRSDVTILAEQTGMYERAKGMQVMEDWIQTFPQIDAVVAANDQMVLGAIQALKGANRLNGVLIVGVDAIKEACQAIDSGEMTLTIYQSTTALGDACYKTIKKFQQGEQVEKQVIVPHENVSKENVSDYL
jgi:inositol transport system substrate-binding protein